MISSCFLVDSGWVKGGASREGNEREAEGEAEGEGGDDMTEEGLWRM